MNVTWDKFYHLIRPHVHGCPLSYVDSALRASAIEFCEKSHIWNEEAICGDLIGGERVYKYNYKNDGVSIVAPINLILRETIPADSQSEERIVDHHVKNVNLQDVERYSPNWLQAEADWPTRYYMQDSNTFVFVERPTGDKWGTIHTLNIVKPSQVATGLPEILYEEWAETIVAGALVRLLSMASRAWGNMQLVSYYRSQFREGISRAREKVMKSYTIQTKSIVAKPFR